MFCSQMCSFYFEVSYFLLSLGNVDPSLLLTSRQEGDMMKY